MSDYDVIVIGSGAGGGTLVRHLAPWAGGSCCSSVVVGCAANRRTGWPRTCSSTGATSRPTLVLRRENRSSPRCTTTSAVRPSCTAPRCTGCGPGLRRAPSPRRDLARVADRVPGDGAVLHEGRGALPGPRRARGGSDRAAGERPVSVPAVSHEPRIQQLSDDLAKEGLHPFHAPCGILLDEGNPPYSKCVRCQNCDGFPCVVHAKSDAEVISVRPALEHPNVTLLPAPSGQARDQPRGHRNHRRRRQRQRRKGDIPERHRGRLVRGREQRQALLASANDAHRTGSPTALTRSGGTTCSTTARPCSRSPRKRTRRCSRRRSGSTTSTSAAARISSSPSATFRWSASPRRRCSAAKNPARRGSLPTGRSKTSPGTPSTSGSPPSTSPRPRTGSRSRATATSSSSTRPATKSQKTPVRQAQGHAREPRHPPRPPAAPSRVPQERDPGRRVRPPGRAPADGVDQTARA